MTNFFWHEVISLRCYATFRYVKFHSEKGQQNELDGSDTDPLTAYK